MASFAPDPQSGTGKAFQAYRHLNERLSVVLPRYLRHSDQIARTIRTSPRLTKRGR